MKTFLELGVSEDIRRAIEELGFENPMPVQEEVIPYLLGNKNDVIALAQTGTGKTASYGIPVIQKTDAKNKQTQDNGLCLLVLSIGLLNDRNAIGCSLTSSCLRQRDDIVFVA